VVSSMTSRIDTYHTLSAKACASATEAAPTRGRHIYPRSIIPVQSSRPALEGMLIAQGEGGTC
jgi:hypothetical protein